MMPVIGLRTTRVSSKTWRRNWRSCQSSARRGGVPAAWSRARARLRSFPPPPPRRPLRLSGSTTASAAASGWKKGSARSSATTAGVRGIAATRDSIPARLDRRDRLDFNQPVRMRERLYRDERRGGQLLAEDLLADRHQIGAVPDVRQVRVDLDDALDRSARRLHVSQESPEHFARLPLEVAGMEDAARLVVRHLTGKEEYRLCAGDLDDLAVRRRIVDRLRAELLDLRHKISPLGEGGSAPLSTPLRTRGRVHPALSTQTARAIIRHQWRPRRSARGPSFRPARPASITSLASSRSCSRAARALPSGTRTGGRSPTSRWAGARCSSATPTRRPSRRSGAARRSARTSPTSPTRRSSSPKSYRARSHAPSACASAPPAPRRRATPCGSRVRTPGGRACSSSRARITVPTRAGP